MDASELLYENMKLRSEIESLKNKMADQESVFLRRVELFRLEVANCHRCLPGQKEGQMKELEG